MKNVSFFLMGLFLLFAANNSFSQGDFWEQTNGPLGGDILSLTINGDGHIFAGNRGGGVFRSTDNGDNWTVINTGLPDFTFVFALAINGAGHIFAGTDGNGMFRSTDNGDNWICQFSCHQQQRRHFCRDSCRCVSERRIYNRGRGNFLKHPVILCAGTELSQSV